MKRIIIRSMLTLGLVAACAVAGSSRLYAQELPKVDAILDKEAEAVGGKEVNQNVKTVVMKGKLAIKGVKIDFVIQQAPNKYSKELTLDGFGSELIVVNGDAAWKKNSITGAEILKGDERAKAYREAAEVAEAFRRVGNWRKLYKEVKNLGEEQIDGKPAHKVHVVTQEGRVWIDYFDKESGLMVRRQLIEEPGQGKSNMVQHFSDFRKVDGIVHAFTTRIVDGDTEAIITIEQLEQNGNIPDERFAMPNELRRQVEKQ